MWSKNDVGVFHILVILNKIELNSGFSDKGSPSRTIMNEGLFQNPTLTLIAILILMAVCFY